MQAYISLDLLHFSKKIENHNYVDAGAHKVGKIISFWSNFNPNSPDIAILDKIVDFFTFSHNFPSPQVKRN